MEIDSGFLSRKRGIIMKSIINAFKISKSYKNLLLDTIVFAGCAIGLANYTPKNWKCNLGEWKQYVKTNF